jgi:signal transduction histidine kinase
MRPLGRKPRADNRLRTLLLRAVTAQTTALVLILAVATGLLITGRALEHRVRQEAESIRALQELRAEIVTAQSSVRGYTLVGREQFLEPYRLAVPAVSRTLADARSAVEQDELGRVARVEAVFGEWRRRFAEPTIAFVRAGRVEAAEALARTGSGKRRIDGIKAELAALVAQEEREIDDEERRTGMLGVLAIACIAALCAGVAASGRLVLRRLNVRLTEPLDGLAEAARSLGRGDLSARAEERGVDEVVALGNSFNDMADEIEELVAELRRQDAMKDRLVAAVSHELRTPLTAIKGYLEGVLEEEPGPLNEQQRDELEIVARNVTRLQDLADDLLTLARLQSGRIEFEPVRFDVGELLAELRTELEPAARKERVELRLQLDGPVEVEADPLRIHQAVGNLIGNAIKFTPGRGRVALRAYAHRDEAVIEVADRGVGIPEAELPRLRDRFYRASTAGAAKGTGLGLSITHDIVEGHGGRIEVESRVGHGSTFRIRLPSRRPAAAS